jgi:hypothetical protein
MRRYVQSYARRDFTSRRSIVLVAEPTQKRLRQGDKRSTQAKTAGNDDSHCAVLGGRPQFFEPNGAAGVAFQ